jgi:hypothetical protein
MKNIVLTTAILFSTTIGLFLGDMIGKASEKRTWQERLIQADLAEYNRKSGEWQMRSMDDIKMSAVILGKVSGEVAPQ